MASKAGKRKQPKGSSSESENSHSGDGLHLHSLSIAGFRGLDHLVIPKLGRVTLLAGNNSVGKTTVLDAVRLYAAQGHVSALTSLLESREELLDTVDDDGDPATIMNWPALFHGRTGRLGDLITISTDPEAGVSNSLSIEAANENRSEVVEDVSSDPRRRRRAQFGAVETSLLVKFGDVESFIDP